MDQESNRMANAGEASRLIHRCMRHNENARFLRRLPGLQLDQELPSPLRDLLGRLHQVEGNRGEQ